MTRSNPGRTGLALAAGLLAAGLAGVGPWGGDAIAQTQGQSQGQAQGHGQAPAQQPAAMPDPDTTVVAEVGDRKIYLAQILRMIQNLPEQYRQAPIQMIFPAMRDRAIDGQLVANAGRDAGVGERAAVEQRVRSAADDIISEVYLTEYLSEKITKEMIQDEYDAYVAANPAGEEVKARHILLESEDDAKAVIAELGQGADFATLAGERSTGPSASQGGDLGWFGEGQMVPEFETAAFATEPGTFTTEPVQSQFGWHVILVEDRRQGTVPTIEEIENDLTQEATRRILTGLLESLRGDAAIKRYNFDGSPAQQ